MEITLTLSDELAPAFLAGAAAANNWTELSPEQIAARLCEQVKTQLINQSLQGQTILAKRAAEDAYKATADAALTIAIK